jgi:hypothetical protein
MKKVTIIDNTNKYDAYVPEEDKELEKIVDSDRKQNLKEHLYMGYLIIGTIAFTLGILISIKRLNGKG